MYKLPLTSTHVSKGINQPTSKVSPFVCCPSQAFLDQHITRVNEEQEQEQAEDWLA
jgi:hypothetical protein